MKRLLVVLGPTATGKTDLGLKLAKKYHGEIISADSRQVYTGLDIGTGKLPGKEVKFAKHKDYWEMDGVKVWMYDVVSPKVQFTVKDYLDKALPIIKDISDRGKLPIVVGGTGLYIKALLEGFPNLSVPTDPKLREKLEKLSLENLQDKLRNLSLEKYQSLNFSDQSNKRRLLRSIELYLMYPFTKSNDSYSGLSKTSQVLMVGLTAPRQILKNRIFQRLISRIDQGLIEEGKRLVLEGISLGRLEALGLEYRFLAYLIEDKITKEQFVNQLAAKIGQYAKRQITWFKREKDINWFEITDPTYLAKVEKLTQVWYDSTNDTPV